MTDAPVAADTGLDHTAEIAKLQRELLAMLKSAKRWTRDEPAANVLSAFAAPRSALDIRRRILDLDPKACLYEAWGGAMPEQGK